MSNSRFLLLLMMLGAVLTVIHIVCQAEPNGYVHPPSHGLFEPYLVDILGPRPWDDLSSGVTPKARNYDPNASPNHSAEKTSIPPDMAHIPAGEFMMGDNFGAGASAERPVHLVKLDSFYMSICEITNRQYCDFLNSAKSKRSITVSNGVVYKADSGKSFPYCDTNLSSPYSRVAWNRNVFRAASGKERHPLVKVTWYGAVAYCNWRSEQEGRQKCYDLSTWELDVSKKGYRLPTEAEWEYAARGGSYNFKYPWRDNKADCNQANYDYSNPLNLSSYPYTSPVGYYTDYANGYGLYDMAGNVWEWCHDWYDLTYYASRPTPDINPTGPAVSHLSYRVLRGGAWNFKPSYCRVAFRFGFKPDGRNYFYGVGFRPVLDLE